MISDDISPVELNYQLLRKLGRVSYSERDVHETRELLYHPQLDKGLFMAACFKQKIAGLAYFNLKRWGFQRLIPWMGMTLQLFYSANVERNRKMQVTARNLLDQFALRGIDVRPLKGAVLVPLIYSDGGSRLLSDLDLFADRHNLEGIAAIFNELGYHQSEPNTDPAALTPLSREEKLLWQIKMFEAPPFYKAVDDGFLGYWGYDCVDLSFGFSFAEAADIAPMVLLRESRMAGMRTLSEIDFFIQLCGHLYKEASNESWIEIDLDINLIKFCDVREFVLKMLGPSQFSDIKARAIELNVEKAIFFSLYHVFEIYRDELIGKMIEALAFTFSDMQFMTDIYRQSTRPVGSREKSLVEAIGLV